MYPNKSQIQTRKKELMAMREQLYLEKAILDDKFQDIEKELYIIKGIEELETAKHGQTKEADN